LLLIDTYTLNFSSELYSWRLYWFLKVRRFPILFGFTRCALLVSIQIWISTKLSTHFLQSSHTIIQIICNVLNIIRSILIFNHSPSKPEKNSKNMFHLFYLWGAWIYYPLIPIVFNFHQSIKHIFNFCIKKWENFLTLILLIRLKKDVLGYQYFPAAFYYSHIILLNSFAVLLLLTRKLSILTHVVIFVFALAYKTLF
jgi:hypothetical protein